MAKPVENVGLADVCPTKMYSVQQAAGFLGVGVSTIYDMIERGEIAATKVGIRKVLGSTILSLLGDEVLAELRAATAAATESNTQRQARADANLQKLKSTK